MRPPPISMRSLASAAARTNIAGSSSGSLTSPASPISERLNSWEPESPTSPAMKELRAALRSTPEPQPGSPPMAAEAPLPTAIELSELERRLRDVTDRDQLIELSVVIASRFARVIALFSVHRGMVQGMRCSEEGDRRAIYGVLMPLEPTSMLTRAARLFVPFRVDPRDEPVDARVQQLLTARVVTEVCLFPVVVDRRVVNLLYASHGSEPLGAMAFGALSLLAEQMGAAYGQLILNHKASTS